MRAASEWIEGRILNWLRYISIVPFASVLLSPGLAAGQDSLYTSPVSPVVAAAEGVPTGAGASDQTGFSPWWQQQVTSSTRDASPVGVSVNSLLMSALANSAQVKVFSDLPLIRETAITEADAAFDWISFMETRWDDTNEPVGSTLTTGGPSRFRDQNFNYSVGARRRNTYGGQFEVSQRIGHQQNNSVFFVPNDQGNARITLSYTQPLMRGAGRVYNTSLTVLAQIDAKIARDEFSRQLQSHLLEVTRSYWTLYLERASLLQKKRLLGRAEEILNDLARRQSLDTVNSQVVRARAAVESRRAEILRAVTAVKNAESRIRSLTNDPAWGDSDLVELIPNDMPFQFYTDVDMQTSLATAMRSRPEIGQAIKQCKASCVRMNMARNEVLPALNLVLETYASGLRGSSNISNAFTDQFDTGRPSYSAGLQYEVPIWNRAAKARLQRRRLEVRQLQNQFRATTETLKLEVAVAVRELSTSFQEMAAKYRAMQAAGAEVEYISERWKTLGGEDRSAALMLEDLLNAQNRLADTEYGFLNASLTYNLAQMNYKKAVGTLLQDEQVSISRNCNCRMPGYDLSISGQQHFQYQSHAVTTETAPPVASQSVSSERAVHTGIGFGSSDNAKGEYDSVTPQKKTSPSSTSRRGVTGAGRASTRVRWRTTTMETNASLSSGNARSQVSDGLSAPTIPVAAPVASQRDSATNVPYLAPTDSPFDRPIKLPEPPTSFQ